MSIDSDRVGLKATLIIILGAILTPVAIGIPIIIYGIYYAKTAKR